MNKGVNILLFWTGNLSIVNMSGFSKVWTWCSPSQNPRHFLKFDTYNLGKSFLNQHLSPRLQRLRHPAVLLLELVLEESLAGKISHRASGCVGHLSQKWCSWEEIPRWVIGRTQTHERGARDRGLPIAGTSEMTQSRVVT